ncbi:hypothetical protein ACJZ2D_012135 [Fusarium nematophilum]
MRRFLFGLGMGLGLTDAEAVAVFQGIVTTFEGQPLCWDAWKKTILDELKDDPRLATLQQKSSRSFPTSRTASPVPRFATCSHEDCDRPSVRGRSCAICVKHLCAVHILPKYHTCRSANQVDDATWEMGIQSEVEAILAQVDVPELVRVASSLRDGTPCKFSPGEYLGRGAIMGCANYHAWIIFDDGVKWLARIPRTTVFSDIPLDLVEYLVESEYATLKWLEGLSIPAPKAHGFGLSSDPDNLAGVSYIFEDAMPGEPFDAYRATAEQKSRVYEQYASILAEIGSHPVTQACSLMPGDDGTRQAAIASNRFLTLGKHGPFDTPLEYFTSIAEHYLGLIADGQVYPDYPKEAFIFYLLLRDRVAPVLASANAATGGFFLKHVDDKGDHILVDKDFNVTAVIDWQFARFVPACEAFGPSLFTADLARLYGGVPDIGVDDQLLAESLNQKGREDLSDFAAGSELVRRFHFGLASGLRRSEVLGMIRMLVFLLVGDDDMSDLDVEAWVEEQWKGSAGELGHDRVGKLVAGLENEGIAGPGEHSWGYF